MKHQVSTQTAQDEGMEAAFMDRNPYPLGTSEHKAWAEGWKMAHAPKPRTRLDFSTYSTRNTQHRED